MYERSSELKALLLLYKKNQFQKSPFSVQDSGPKPLKYGEVAYAHTSPFLGILPPGATQPVVENNMYRAPIYEHTISTTEFLVIRTRYVWNGYKFFTVLVLGKYFFYVDVYINGGAA